MKQSDVSKKLESRLEILDTLFQNYALRKPVKLLGHRLALQEGLISQLWQTWNFFARATILCSLSGGMDSDGNRISSPLSHLSELEQLWLATEFSKKKKPSIVKPLRGAHLEATWGDYKKSHEVFARCLTSNAGHLDSCFGAALSIKDLQVCRNSSAHISVNGQGAVKKLQSKYLENRFRHPSDMAFWVDPASNDYLWNTWIAEMRIVANLV